MSEFNRITQLFCVWSGLLYAGLLGIAMVVIAPFFPPPAPSAGAPAIAALFQTSASGIRSCGALWMLASGVYVPWICLIFIQMKRVEGEFSLLSHVQLIGGVMTMIITFLGGAIWDVAVYRNYTDPQIVQLLNDLSWFVLLFNISAAFFQNMAIGIVGLSDRRARPVFPRWISWFNIWLAISFLPDILIPYFKIGPFAWNGVLAFYIPMTAFFIWFMVMTPVLLAAVRGQAAELRLLSERSSLLEAASRV